MHNSSLDNLLKKNSHLGFPWYSYDVQERMQGRRDNTKKKIGPGTGFSSHLCLWVAEQMGPSCCFLISCFSKCKIKELDWRNLLIIWLLLFYDLRHCNTSSIKHNPYYWQSLAFWVSHKMSFARGVSENQDDFMVEYCLIPFWSRGLGKMERLLGMQGDLSRTLEGTQRHMLPTGHR